MSTFETDRYTSVNDYVVSKRGAYENGSAMLDLTGCTPMPLGRTTEPKAEYWRGGGGSN